MTAEPTRPTQVDYVVERVLEHREAGVDLKQQAVLFRAAHHSDLLELELARRNIPFVKYGGLKFLEAAHVKDVLCFLRWAENPRDCGGGVPRAAAAARHRARPRAAAAVDAPGGRRLRAAPRCATFDVAGRRGEDWPALSRCC